jgi:phage-related protein
MDLQVLSALVLIAFMCIFLLMMWKVYKGMKLFLKENIEEALLVSGEYIGEQIQGIDRSMRERMNVIEKSNYALREEITRKLEAIASTLSEANDKAETGINSIVKELNYIIPSIRDEITKLLDSISTNIDSFQKGTIKNLESEIKRLIQVIDTSCENLEKSSDEQRKLLTNMAGTIQNALTNGERDIQSAFEKTHKSMQDMITDSMKKIESDYQYSMKEMFRAMADNLAAITQELRKTNTPAAPAESAPVPKKRGSKPKNDASSGDETKNEESKS